MKLFCIVPSSLVFAYLLLSLISLTSLVSSQEIEHAPESYELDSILKRSPRTSQEDIYRMFVLLNLNKLKDSQRLRAGIKRIGSEFIGKRYSQPEDIEKRLGSEFLGKRTIGSEFLGKR